MANPVTDLLLPAATERFILLANHVLSSAPAATERLNAHVGRRLRIEVENWRVPLPPPPPLTLRITPAGLFESAVGRKLQRLRRDRSATHDQREDYGSRREVVCSHVVFAGWRVRLCMPAPHAQQGIVLSVQYR